MPRLTRTQHEELLNRFASGEPIDRLAREFCLNRYQCYRLQNREIINSKARNRIAQNRELHNARCNASKHKNWGTYLERNNAANRITHARLKQEAITRLGGKCVHCGYDTDIRAQQIDHIHSDGAKERANNPNQLKFYKTIIELGGQGKYQVLCANCNQIKRMEAKEHLKGRQRKSVAV